MHVTAFVVAVHFLCKGLTSLRSNNGHQTVQSISTTDTANRNVSVVEKQNIGEGTVELLIKAKAKEILKVKSKCVVSSTEKLSEAFRNISCKISVKGQLRKSLGY